MIVIYFRKCWKGSFQLGIGKIYERGFDSTLPSDRDSFLSRFSPCLKISIGSGATVPILRSEGNFDSITRYVRQTWWLDKIVQKSLQEIFITAKRKWNGGVSGYL